MVKRALFCFLFVIFSFSFFPERASAETVFVYIEKGNINLNNEIKEDAVLWINRVEDGIMDILFESGHIVFSNDSGRNQIKEFEKLNQLAKSGGAAILISAVLNLKITDDIITISGEYKVYNLYTDNIIYKNNYIFNDVVQKNSSILEEKLFLAGQSVGKQIGPAL